MNADFHRILTLVRKERKISQKQAAADLGISQALLSHYEKGIRECGLEFLVRAADYYNVTCDYLLGRSPLPNGSENSDGSTEETEKSRMISDSQNIILKLCEQNDVSENITDYLNACVYKLLRIIYNSNPVNDRNAFRISAAESENLTDCIISHECAGIKRKCGKNGIKITVSDLSESFPDSHSLLSLIKITEDKILSL